MQVATRTSVEVTTRRQSLQILKNTVSLGVSSVLYLRNLFAESAFSSVWFEGLQLVQLRPTDTKSAFIVNLLRHGVNDALQKECLEQLLVGIHEAETDALLESYEFTFGYAGRKPEVSVSRISGDTRSAQGELGGRPVTKSDAKKQTEALLQSVCTITQQLDPLPDNSYVSLRLLFDETRTPSDYVPRGFKSKMDNISFGGEVPFTTISEKIDTKHHTLELSIQSLADPPQILPVFRTREGGMRIVDEVMTYMVSTGEMDIDKLTATLGKNCEPFIAAALAQLLSPGLPGLEERKRGLWGFAPHQPPETTSRAKKLGPPPHTEAPKESAHAEIPRATKALGGPPGSPTPPQNEEKPEVMRTAVALIEQCKDLAKIKRLFGPEEVADFCVVSPEVAGELLLKMQALGLVRRGPGRSKQYLSTLYKEPTAQKRQESQQHPRNSSNNGVCSVVTGFAAADFLDIETVTVADDPTPPISTKRKTRAAATIGSAHDRKKRRQK